MDELRGLLNRGDLVHDVRRLLKGGAEDHAKWLRENIRHALVTRRQDAVAVSALTGLAPGTVRGFLNGRPSSIHNVLLIAEAVGYTLADLDQVPDEFRRLTDDHEDGGDVGAIGASLLAFDESPTAMAIVLLDDTIVKTNRQLRALLGFEEGELVGSRASNLAVTSDEDQVERSDELAATDVTHGRAMQLRRKDGSFVHAVTSAIIVRDDGGHPRYVIARATPVEVRPSLTDPDLGDAAVEAIHLVSESSQGDAGDGGVELSVKRL
jgi:PAS domain S-box-containing protein